MSFPRLVFQRALPPEPRRGAVPFLFSLSPGLHTFLGSPANGTVAIAKLAAGMVRPRSGRVALDGREPYGDPELRARIGATAWEAMLPERGKVEAFLEACEHVRKAPVGEMLEHLGLGSLRERRLEALSADERRAIDLAIALATPDPVALILTEPFANTAGAHRAVVLDALLRAAHGGACVVVTTASVADAVEVGGQIHLLEAGRIARTIDALDAIALPGREVELRILSDDPRTLAGALTCEEAISSVAWDAERGPSLVSVRGPHLDRVALAIASAARATSVRIHSIAPVAPSLDEVRAASSGLVLAAYHAAYRYGSGFTQPASPAVVVPSIYEGSS